MFKHDLEVGHRQESDELDLPASRADRNAALEQPAKSKSSGRCQLAASTRGRKAQDSLAKRTTDEERQLAARKIQKVHRGRMARHKVESMKIVHAGLKQTHQLHEAEAEYFDVLESSAVKIRHIQRGRSVRRASALHLEETLDAETRANRLTAESRRKTQQNNWQEEFRIQLEEQNELQKIQKNVEQVQAASSQQAASSDQDQSHQQELERAAIKIQSICRGRQSRKKTQHFKSNSSIEDQAEQDAALKIQSTFRGRQARKKSRRERKQSLKVEDRAEHDAALKIQSTFRGRQARKEISGEREQSLKVEDREEQDAALKIQSTFRGRQARKKSRRERKQSLKVQDQAEHDAALKIQSTFRGRQVRKESSGERKQSLKVEDREEQDAALKIQSTFRGRQARKKSRRERKQSKYAKEIDLPTALHLYTVNPTGASRRLAAELALKDIYNVVIATILGRQKEEELQQHRAAVLMQSAARGLFARKEVKEMKAASHPNWMARSSTSTIHRRESVLLNPCKTLKRTSSVSEDAKNAIKKVQSTVYKKLVKKVKPAKQAVDNDKFSPVAMRALLEQHQKRATITNKETTSALKLQTAFRAKMARNETEKLKKAREQARKAALALDNEWQRGVRFSFCPGMKPKLTLPVEKSPETPSKAEKQDGLKPRRSKRKSEIKFALSEIAIPELPTSAFLEDPNDEDEASPKLAKDPWQQNEEASAVGQETGPSESKASRNTVKFSDDLNGPQSQSADAAEALVDKDLMHLQSAEASTGSQPQTVDLPAAKMRNQASRRKLVQPLTDDELAQLHLAAARIQGLHRRSVAKKEARRLRLQKQVVETTEEEEVQNKEAKKVEASGHCPEQQVASTELDVNAEGPIAGSTRGDAAPPETACFAAELLEAAARAAASQSAARPFTRRTLGALWPDELVAGPAEVRDVSEQSLFVSVLVCDVAVQFEGDQSDGEFSDVIVRGSPRVAKSRRPLCSFVQAREAQTEACAFDEFTDVGSSAEDSALDSHGFEAVWPSPPSSAQPAVFSRKTLPGSPQPEALLRRSPRRGQRPWRPAPAGSMRPGTLFDTLQPFQSGKVKMPETARGFGDAVQADFAKGPLRVQPGASQSSQPLQPCARGFADPLHLDAGLGLMRPPRSARQASPGSQPGQAALHAGQLSQLPVRALDAGTGLPRPPRSAHQGSPGSQSVLSASQPSQLPAHGFSEPPYWDAGLPRPPRSARQTSAGSQPSQAAQSASQPSQPPTRGFGEQPCLDSGTGQPRPPRSARPVSVRDDVKPPPMPESGKVLTGIIGQHTASDLEEGVPCTPASSIPAEQGSQATWQVLPPCTPRVATSEFVRAWQPLFAPGTSSDREDARTSMARAVSTAGSKATAAAAACLLPPPRSAKSDSRQCAKKEARSGMKKLPWLKMALKVGHEPGALEKEVASFSRRLLDRCYSEESRPGTTNAIVGGLLVDLWQGDRHRGMTWRS